MKLFLSEMASLYRDENGATLIEYGIVLAAIAVVCIAVVQSIGARTDLMYQSAAKPKNWTP
jgi:pilus assembly protein Flp/PilA